MAYGDNAQVTEFTGQVGPDGILNWKAPVGNWRLYAVFQGWHGKQVERAGKGGEGHVIDHFSEEATRKFLSFFDENKGSTDFSELTAAGWEPLESGLIGPVSLSPLEVVNE